MAQATRYHLAPHGPDICRADPSKPKAKGCPFGGASGNENHFPTMEEAERAYEVQMESSGNGLIAASVSSDRSFDPRTTIRKAVISTFNNLVSDSSYGVSEDLDGFTADGSEGLKRFCEDFAVTSGGDFGLETRYEDGSDEQVIRSVYISGLDIEIRNQNSEMDLEELDGYRELASSRPRAYWREP